MRHNVPWRLKEVAEKFISVAIEVLAIQMRFLELMRNILGVVERRSPAASYNH
jgi:hypothetical protein